MPDDETFSELMERLRAGDEEAAALIFRRFAGRLVALAHQRLDVMIRQKVDAEDVVQSVFKSFFARQADQPYDLDDWDGLWHLLARITVYKCGHRIGFFHAARRDARRDVAVPDLAEEWGVVAREPTPAEAAMLVETMEALMRELSDRDRRILALSLQGCQASEVAIQARCSERTVRRVLGFIRDRLEDMRAAAEPS
jgi:RNA polymerase sigma-70 factor (ECF subfamily)